VYIAVSIIFIHNLPFSEIFPTIDSLPASGLTPRLYDWTVFSEHCQHCWHLWSYIGYVSFVLLCQSEYWA